MNVGKKMDETSSANVLIVDDNERNRFAFIATLADLDCNLFEAQDGSEALKLVTEHNFALILLDVQMPDMDGFEVATLLKKHKHTKDIPIVFITALSKEQEHIRLGHSIGAVDYIVKPVDPLVLLNKVSVYLDYYFQKSMMKKQISNLSKLQSQLSQNNIHLEKLAKRDMLTGLLNRWSFDEVLKHTIKVAEDNKAKFSLLYMDLDDFKLVNDHHGHDVGDQLLKLASFRMREVLRSSDYYLPGGEDCLLARLGGDEFAIILSDVYAESVISVIADRLIAAFKSPLIINQLALRIGVSIGVVIYPEGGETADVLCRHADSAMYKAKNLGKHRYHFYRFESEHDYQSSLVLESSIKGGIEDGDFYLLYQPIYELKSGKIVGAEALCRWNHPLLGVIMPDVFIPIAESSGLIVDLGRWVLKEVANTIKDLPKNLQEQLIFAVNVSMVQFYDKDFLKFVASLLKSTGIDGRMLEMEITETVISQDSFHYEGIIQQLKTMGIQLSIDDFGTGYSSLRRLHQLSISTLKVDRSFVAKVPHDEKNTKMTVSIIDLAKSLNLKIIAEGIEDKKQLEFLIEKNCPWGQGYYFSRPIPFKDFKKLLKRQE